jgi:hypothetical protein
MMSILLYALLVSWLASQKIVEVGNGKITPSLLSGQQVEPE